MADGSDERRNEAREEAFFPAEVRCPSGKVRFGAVADASSSGVALLVTTEVQVGEHLVIAIELENGEVAEVHGLIVRREEVPRGSPWRYRVGVSLDPPSTVLRDNAHRIHERQAKVWRND